ncbi:hypothetical protein GWI68_16710 [Proteus sp. G2669]|uniref:hypothetical protein n=1 Tax=Proteus sp. G2669 TaxID=2698881 RepID=UPI001412F7D1|nr:hypothetical protein [Proteus sp. G2669]NBM56355.1 hypothetical protein [Proteus sp. G2669]
MATTPNPTHPLLTIQLDSTTDFTTLVDYCDKFVDALINSEELSIQMALCCRLNVCLTLLQSTLDEPIPPHLVQCFIANKIPPSLPRFDFECTELCQHCITLTQFLAELGFSNEKGKSLIWLLNDLINYFVAEMRAPRWLRTLNGVEPLDKVMV